MVRFVSIWNVSVGKDDIWWIVYIILCPIWYSNEKPDYLLQKADIGDMMLCHVLSLMVALPQKSQGIDKPNFVGGFQSWGTAK